MASGGVPDDRMVVSGAGGEGDTRLDALVFDSSSLEETEQFLSASYAPMRIGSSSDQSHAHMDRVAVPTVTVDRLDFQFEMSYDVHPLGRLCLCVIESGGIANHRVDGWSAEESFGPGQVFSFAPPDRPFSGRIRHTTYTNAVLDPAILGRIADPDNESGRSIELLDHRPISAAAGAQLRRTILHLRSVLAEPTSDGSALVTAAAVDYLAARVLSTFPTSLPATSSDPGEATPAVVRRARAYMEENAGAAISAADIAAAANVSIRALQYAFRRHLGTTPMDYLRRVRLERARADLAAADPYGTEGVTTIAARWGFLSASRFAGLYRGAFGEQPSRTLRS